jgi:hypothetical protein
MRYRFCEEDRAKFGGPEWLDIEDVIAWSTDADYDKLVDAESQILALLDDPSKSLTWTVAQFVAETRTSTLLPMQRIRVWLCLIAAGSDVKLADFKPKLLAGEIRRREDDDADPPQSGADSSATTGSEPSSPESETSTESSTPGSPSSSE